MGRRINPGRAPVPPPRRQTCHYNYKERHRLYFEYLHGYLHGTISDSAFARCLFSIGFELPEAMLEISERWHDRNRWGIAPQEAATRSELPSG